MRIRAALESFLDTLTRVEAPLRQWLADGLSRPQIDAALGGLPVSLADEVYEYFTWRNGLRADRDMEYELFPGGVMLSVEEAIADYRQLLQTASVIAQQTGLPPSQIWDERWFPLFRNAAGGDYHVTIGGTQPPATAPLYLVMNEERRADAVAFDSLTTLIETVAACFDAGAYTTADGFIQEDRVRAAEIIRARNPERVKQALEWLPDNP
jgi:cell wall assembly regulator SMI1